MEMNHMMVLCMIKPSYYFVDFGKTRECFLKVAELVKSIEIKTGLSPSQQFSSGSQTHERMAFVFTTKLSKDEVQKQVNDICGEYYNVDILD